MKISCVQKIVFISGFISCLQVYAMQSIAEPVKTCDVGCDEKLKITPSLIQDPEVKFLVIMAAQHEASKSLEKSSSSLNLRLSEMSAASKSIIDKADKNVGTEENSDKDETLSSSSEHFSAEIELGKKGGGCFYCKSHCKFKTIAKDMAKVGGGILVGLLAL